MSGKKNAPDLCDMTSGESRRALPVHIGFIMDGNGRWALKRGMARQMGHARGGKAFRAIARRCKDLGIKYITFYAFSTENWKRSEAEKRELFRLFKEYMNEAEDYAKDKTRLVFLGDKTPFEPAMRDRMTELEEKSAGFDETTIMIAMNYGGRADILEASRRMAEMVRGGYIKSGDVNEEFFSELLYTGAAPDVDLCVRTGGDMRISNFLLWQCAYAEYYFTETLWPDFTTNELDAALDEYARRQRRFGGA